MLKALVVETVAPEVRGRALGVYFSITSVAALLASVITGELWKVYGPRLPFCLSASTAVVSAALLLLWRTFERRRHAGRAGLTTNWGGGRGRGRLRVRRIEASLFH